ncbi:hypothetical protein pb186bvf_010812 [Paramecium bursaria]
MIFERELNELYSAIQLKDWKRIEKACFALKGSIGLEQIYIFKRQILAFDMLQRTKALYEVAKNRTSPPRDQDIIDLYHRYFDFIEGGVELAQELEKLTKKKLNIEQIKGYRVQLWPSYIQFLQTYVKEYSQPSENPGNTMRCQQCKECNMF